MYWVRDGNTSKEMGKVGWGEEDSRSIRVDTIDIKSENARRLERGDDNLLRNKAIVEQTASRGGESGGLCTEGEGVVPKRRATLGTTSTGDPLLNVVKE
mmetsp:Transcript_8594/g.17442  ORF Transcript_8594/g.17442 Transcript_8594/m.17442 type:complete len:99 (+) Transcript_8594:417-713(+)